MPTIRDRGVVWCEVCQQSETEVWCGMVRVVPTVRDRGVVWCELCVS